MKRDIKRYNAIFWGLVILLFSITGCGNKKEEMKKKKALSENSQRNQLQVYALAF